ncbi:MAG: protein-glutamate O-methyltransferase CheR [Holophagales bacterium]|jgi:chemotaxis methyl-accepting protein methylase|nr:protein-glutamate O-methyltransferase CheR [Holophagales bacterium]
MRSPEPDLPAKGLLTELVTVLGPERSGNLSSFDEAFLHRSVETRRVAVGEPDAVRYLGRLRDDPHEAEAFLSSLHVSYSEFFRNPLTFAVLEQIVLPRLLGEVEGEGRPEVRVWSAGCAGGEEPFSVAILLDELIASRGREPRYRVFATDLREAGLAAACSGVFGTSALRNVRQRHLESCFTRTGESYVVSPRLRARVDFSVHDLLNPGTSCPPASIYGAFDLVLCCNLLLYYRQEMRRLVLDRLYGCLAPGGYLVTGETERAMVDPIGGFTPVMSQAAVFRKG